MPFHVVRKIESLADVTSHAGEVPVPQAVVRAPHFSRGNPVEDQPEDPSSLDADSGTSCVAVTPDEPDVRKAMKGIPLHFHGIYLPTAGAAVHFKRSSIVGLGRWLESVTARPDVDTARAVGPAMGQGIAQSATFEVERPQQQRCRRLD